MEVKASLKFARVGAQKARLVADLIRGKNVNEAINILTFTRKRVAEKFQKLLKSAIANAEENHKVLDVDDLVIKNVQVDEGATWTWCDCARGGLSLASTGGRAVPPGVRWPGSPGYSGRRPKPSASGSSSSLAQGRRTSRLGWRSLSRPLGESRRIPTP